MRVNEAMGGSIGIRVERVPRVKEMAHEAVGSGKSEGGMGLEGPRMSRMIRPRRLKGDNRRARRLRFRGRGSGGASIVGSTWTDSEAITLSSLESMLMLGVMSGPLIGQTRMRKVQEGEET